MADAVVRIPASATRRRARPTRDAFRARVAGEIRALLGPERVQRLVLYGSRADGTARDTGGVDDSDWDVAVFVDGEPTRAEEDALFAWSDALMIETNEVVSILLLPRDGWLKRTVFMHNLRFDAIDL